MSDPSAPQPPYRPQQWPAHPVQPAPAAPGWGPPPAPPRKRPTALIVTAVVAAGVLVLCAAVAVVVHVAARGGAKPSASSPARSTPSAAASASTAGDRKLRLTAPDTIGQWKKAANQDRARQMGDALGTVAITEPFAAQYQDTKAASHIAVLWGGTGPTLGGGREQDQLSSYMFQLTQSINGGAAVTPAPVDPGIIGGVAACAPTEQYGITITTCLWIADGVMLGFMFSDVQPDEAGGYVHDMLPAVVVLS